MALQFEVHASPSISRSTLVRLHAIRTRHLRLSVTHGEIVLRAPFQLHTLSTTHLTSPWPAHAQRSMVAAGKRRQPRPTPAELEITYDVLTLEQRWPRLCAAGLRCFLAGAVALLGLVYVFAGADLDPADHLVGPSFLSGLFWRAESSPSPAPPPYHTLVARPPPPQPSPPPPQDPPSPPAPPPWHRWRYYRWLPKPPPPPLPPSRPPRPPPRPPPPPPPPSPSPRPPPPYPPSPPPPPLPPPPPPPPPPRPPPPEPPPRPPPPRR